MHAFIPADPVRVAATLTPDAIHVWRFPYRRSEGRAPFRSLVSHYLGGPPEHVSFVDDARGRPRLATPNGSLDVNWSHSGSQAVLAVASSIASLGIDLEARRPRPRALALARRFFHPQEHDALAALAEARVEETFLRLWTAKEAVLKGHGEGIRYGLHRIIFGFTTGLPAPWRFDGDAGPAAAWHVERLDDDAAMACIAWRGAGRRVACFDLSTDQA